MTLVSYKVCLTILYDTKVSYIIVKIRAIWRGLDGAYVIDDAYVSIGQIDYILEKSVSCQKKDRRGHARPSFFCYDNDKDLKVYFVVARVI